MGERAAERGWTSIAVYVTLVCCIAAISDKYFDQPVRRLLSGYFLRSAKNRNPTQQNQRADQ
jgi:peptidoglycan/LPS O-acetylase OafA/YrhL